MSTEIRHEVLFRADIANIIAALARAVDGMRMQGVDPIYCDGVLEGLGLVAEALDLPVRSVRERRAKTVIDGKTGLEVRR